MLISNLVEYLVDSPIPIFGYVVLDKGETSRESRLVIGDGFDEFVDGEGLRLACLALLAFVSKPVPERLLWMSALVNPSKETGDCLCLPIVTNAPRVSCC